MRGANHFSALLFIMKKHIYEKFPQIDIQPENMYNAAKYIRATPGRTIIINGNIKIWHCHGGRFHLWYEGVPICFDAFSDALRYAFRLAQHDYAQRV